VKKQRREHEKRGGTQKEEHREQNTHRKEGAQDREDWG